MKFCNFTSPSGYGNHKNHDCDRASLMAVMSKTKGRTSVSVPLMTIFIHKCSTILCMTLVLIIFPALGTLAGESIPVKPPVQVGGFILGKSIDEFRHRIKKDSRMCIRFQDYLEEVEINMCTGFKSGLISMANCNNTNEIVKIKLKYMNSSKNFFNRLLKSFKEKFGEPDKWKGDPFGVVLAWKWSFKNEKGENISLILQHNNKDEDLKMGNVVKLANTTRIEQEQECFLKKTAKENHTEEPPPMDLSKPATWNYLVPR